MDNDRIGRVTGSPLYPFDGSGALKPMSPLLDAELGREGEGDKPCRRCSDNGKSGQVRWTDDRFLVSDGPASANPVCWFIETVEHLDFEDFDEELAAALGVLTLQLTKAIDALPSVGRVHVHRWGDGSEHYHLWFQGRPARRLELYGWGNILWSMVLDPLTDDQLAADRDVVIDALVATAGGRRVA